MTRRQTQFEISFTHTQQTWCSSRRQECHALEQRKQRGDFTLIIFSQWSPWAYGLGILLLWNKADVIATIVGHSEQEINALIEVRNPPCSQLFSGIYASHRLIEWKVPWENMEVVADANNWPWFAMGDFNELLNNEEKLRGGPVDISRSTTFTEMLNTCGLINLGFRGPKFTWTNLRYGGALIQERLDKVVATDRWKRANVLHLPRTHSDHCPLLLTLNPRGQDWQPRPFRFETIQLKHLDFKKLVLDIWG